VKIQDDGGNMLPLASLSLERVTEPLSGEEAAVDSVFGVFTVIGNWIIAQIPVVLSLFWSSEAEQLTVIGSICVCALGVALLLLLVTLVVRWIKFR
jgi:hypothetical protein